LITGARIQTRGSPEFQAFNNVTDLLRKLLISQAIIILARDNLDEISWETEVWVADSPAHLIHFNGERFLGPYPESK
jgi:BsuBI/PstI restriction endonuclease domain